MIGSAIKAGKRCFSWIVAKRWRAVAVAAGSGLLVALIIFVWSCYASPDGRYDASMIGATGYNYFEFKDGQAFEVITEANHRQLLGTYFKQGRIWVFRPVEPGPDNYLVPGPTRLRILDDAGNEDDSIPMEREWFHRASTMVETVGSSLMRFLMKFVEE